MTAGPVLLAQVARMLAFPATPSAEAARAAIAADPGSFASALFAEAADSDDVTGAGSARAYLEARLVELADLMDSSTAVAVRASFEQRLAAWGEATPQ